MADTLATLGLQTWERGGENDPTVTFDALRSVLYLIKDELSPWGWKAYCSEFRERMKAEKRLSALNQLPMTGAEPSDGVVAGTPLWQERIDRMLLVEHLKKKLMTAHGEFVEASQLLLKSYGWLVKHAGLAENFVVAITHIPPARSERMDLIQAALEKTRKELKEAIEEFEDYKLDLKRKREVYREKIISNQEITLKRALGDQAIVAWSYDSQRSTALRLAQIRRVLEARTLGLEMSLAIRTEELEESQRQWDEEKEALTDDRDNFKKLYNRMVKAHEQAMEDLKNSQGSAEDMAKMIQVLSTEKHRLTEQVEELEAQKKKMAKQLAELRDEVAKCKSEMRRYGMLLRSGEQGMRTARKEGDLSRLECEKMAVQLRLACQLEAELRDEAFVSRGAQEALRSRVERGLRETEDLRLLLGSTEEERDRLLPRIRCLEVALARCVDEAKETVEDVMNRAKRELEQFKNEELYKVRTEFAIKSEELYRRVRLLEAECHKADEEATVQSPTLKPLVADMTRLCIGCKKTLSYVGKSRC